MKKAGWSIGSFAKILFILIVLLILFLGITNYYGGVNEIIKKMLGEKTDIEISHEENVQVEKDFEILEKQIKKCKDSIEKNCGCLVDLSKFTSDYRIDFTDNEIKLITMRNQRSEGIQMSHFNEKLNCYWNNNLKDNDFTRMPFENEEPYIFKEVAIWTSITGRGNAFYFTYDFNILKINGKMCWLTDKVNEDKIKEVNECQ